MECIQIVEHMNFCRGGAVKYIWRAGSKGGPEKELEDLKKAKWLIEREIARLETKQPETSWPPKVGQTVKMTYSNYTPVVEAIDGFSYTLRFSDGSLGVRLLSSIMPVPRP